MGRFRTLPPHLMRLGAKGANFPPRLVVVKMAIVKKISMLNYLNIDGAYCRVLACSLVK